MAAPMVLSPGQVIEEPVKPEDEAWRENLNIKLICPECREDPPDLIEETSSGDTVCGSCGLVLGDRLIDMRSEWRTFANDENAHDDPSRVGAAADARYDGDQLETSISYADGSSKARELSRTLAKVNQDKGRKNLEEAYSKISALCTSMGLPQKAQLACQHLYKAAENTKRFKTKPIDFLISACLFTACRVGKSHRTFREIGRYTGVNKKEVGKAFKALRDLINRVKRTDKTLADISQQTDLSDGGNIAPAALAERIVDAMSLPVQVAIAARYVIDNSSTVLGGRSTGTVAASAVYFAAHLLGHPKTGKEVAAAADISDGTLRNGYDLMYGEREKLVDPEWLKSGRADLGRLPTKWAEKK